jgi:hypothetical protein
MSCRIRLVILMAAALPLSAGAQSNYLGVLKPPRDFLAGAYSFSGPAAAVNAPGIDPGQRLTLGYKYSRYFSVEGELVDPGRAALDPFASPASLAGGVRSTGFGVDTIATLPVWRFSFYVRVGAFRGDALHGPLQPPSLLADGVKGTRWRAGLGMRYDFTKSLGIKAELERQSPFAAPFAPEGEADQFSVGVSWRF